MRKTLPAVLGAGIFLTGCSGFFQAQPEMSFTYEESDIKIACSRGATPSQAAQLTDLIEKIPQNKRTVIAGQEMPRSIALTACLRILGQVPETK